MPQVKWAKAARLLSWPKVFTGSSPRHRRTRHTPSMNTVDTWMGQTNHLPAYRGAGRHRMSTVVLASLMTERPRLVTRTGNLREVA